MVVEIHVPLLPTPGLPDGAYPFPWIDEVGNFLTDVEIRGGAEVFDDGEEDGDHYVFSVTGAGEEDLLALASRVAGLPGVPAGTYAVVGDDGDGEPGAGRRVALAPAGE
ncbi:hypothetical protein [Streptomyces sp. CAU 1734]|uniref:hypothetical protein n=1 Tax=Streptomyces sp. CAU 1734 TaxID=3140360 RepID=UPI00325FE342